ncbi:hypothetical protein [Metasolibacillus sp.]|uniref:hypothetical protein n=1 Tax=Metasolibacillus sp. TaxID=2703680 RepID=UPI0025EF7F88|nr:hypothetical protein [Metasolibacillus sp.]MCT6925576.1 hypothetical protein [Metasolibacillus sp.]MCT6941828.1 hypothetical protein [Metasolibacillus sp.]
MLNVIGEAFFKQYIDREYHIKGIKWYVWVCSLSLIALMMFFILYAYPNTQKFRCIVGGVVCGVASVIYFKHEKNKNTYAQLGDEKATFQKNIQLIKKILIENHILRLEQLNILISLADTELSGLRLSEKLRKWLYGIISAILIPSTTFVSTLIGNYEQTINYILQVFSLVLMLLVIYQPIKYLLYWSLDTEFNQMLVLKRYLEDVKMMDYVR